MLAVRRVHQGENRSVSVVSIFPEECLVPESSALHSLVEARRTPQKIEDGAGLHHLAGELVMAGLEHLDGTRVKPTEAHLAGQQLCSAVSALETESGALGSKVGERTIGVLGRVITDKKMSGSAVLAAKRARFELSLNRVNTRTGLVRLGAQSRQSGLFTDVAPLILEVAEGDDLPRSFFNSNPALLANTFALISRFGVDGGGIRRISLGLRKASMSTSSPHSRIIAEAAALQSSQVCPSHEKLDPRNRHDYPLAVGLFIDHAANNIDVAHAPVNVQVGIEKARQLVLATSIPPSASRR